MMKANAFAQTKLDSERALTRFLRFVRTAARNGIFGARDRRPESR